jgi:hypothetical protein
MNWCCGWPIIRPRLDEGDDVVGPIVLIGQFSIVCGSPNAFDMTPTAEMQKLA